MKMQYFTPSCDCVLTLDREEITQLVMNGSVSIQPARATCVHKEYKGETREFDVVGMTVCEHIGDGKPVENHYIQFLQIRLGREEDE